MNRGSFIFRWREEILAGLLGMSSKFVECSLGVKYRKINERGEVSGGAMYYLKYGLKKKKLKYLGIVLAFLFAVLTIGGSVGGGNMLQANQAFKQFESFFPAMQNHVRSSLDSLPSQQKEFLDWAFYTGLSCSEIGIRSGKPMGAVKTHTRIGMSKLYELFRPLYERETGSKTAKGGQQIDS